ncbi:MAG TPA: hypothetical protein VIG74_03150 [Alphaproteobacteria bacterium]|jgi:cytochrome c-type biogenesis protein CcmH/NrfG
MISIMIAALLTVATVAWLVHPLMKSGDRRARILMIALPLCALTLYLWRGHPDMPSAAALFEHDTTRATLRALTRDELRLTQSLSQDPENNELKTQLGEVFYARGLAILAEEGDPARAVGYLDDAIAVAPKNAPYLKDLKFDRKKLSNGD